MMNTELYEPSAPEPMTTWINPTAQPITIKVSVPTPCNATCSDPKTTTCRRHRFAWDKDNERWKSWEVAEELRPITWAPGESKGAPSRFDLAIHRVDCRGEHPECRPMLCRKPGEAGPRAVLHGGLAPLLQREGQRYSIDESLVCHPEPVRTMTVAPGDVAGRLAAPAPPDPTLERARARRKASGQ